MAEQQFTRADGVRDTSNPVLATNRVSPARPWARQRNRLRPILSSALQIGPLLGQHDRIEGKGGEVVRAPGCPPTISNGFIGCSTT